MSKHKKGFNRHHCYPSKDRRHQEEIKIIDAEAHRRWHYLVSDRTPENAVRYIARNFLPKEMEKRIMEAIR